MSKEIDRISEQIGCLNTPMIPATLISTKGTHCHVWQCIRTLITEQGTQYLDFVIKCHHSPCDFMEIKSLKRDYDRLKRYLGDIIPDALFVATEVNGQPNVLVMAMTYKPWFNVANPGNEAEVIPLFRRLERAQIQLRHFIQVAYRWYEEEGRVIDLYGVDNLILDRNQSLHYIDSFTVFFYEDLLKIIDDDSTGLKEKIDLSLRRLDYLDYVLKASEKKLIAID
ncbi:hypothetical protein [Thioflexithrix psekupsensis]|uniref:Uncharacterized protein n=1 Tax=Thioflexithrix psekupsensis TaxID=1570016 RepID=A0A251X998_9GAMM|nr:hypothetical protein [Thioflexithrix psekupsensis]OUD14505.1 hypothetical protein TPSD3_09415 [Thioflexithrix psekupsensis]